MKMLLLSAVAAVFAVGCAQQLENPRTINPAQPGVDDLRSRELQRAQMLDVPVPDGFEFVDRGNQSWSYTQGGVKLAELHYWGTTSVAEVVEFYKQTMGQRAYGWSAASGGDSGNALAFKKEGRACSVDIHEGNRGTVIDIRVTGAASGR